MSEKNYYRSTIEGEKSTQWICGCFETKDGFFKFCDKHKDTAGPALNTVIKLLSTVSIVFVSVFVAIIAL